MTLGDFSNPSRIEELIESMKQQSSSSITNISDVVKQWTSVLRTITATSDKDYLNLFVKLKGLSYLNQWVQNALKFSKENPESNVEDFFTVLLGSLEKLPVVKEDPAASEIKLICENLLELESLNIKERVTALIKKWANFEVEKATDLSIDAVPSAIVNEEQVAPTIPDQEASKTQSSSNLSLSNGSELKSDDYSKENPSSTMEEAGSGSGSAGEVKADSPEPSEKKSTPLVDQSSDYGELDALEVARQVAIEVEREVVDYREPVLSPSPNRSSEAFEQRNGKQIVQEGGSSEADKGKCVFDLNEDISMEEPDPFVNSIITNGGMKFEGEASSGQKRKAICMEFDLNVVDNEGEEEESPEVSSKKHEKEPLDLNLFGNEEEAKQQPQPNPHWSLVASSSSSRRPETTRGFDLNNNVPFFDAMGTTKRPEITVMGLNVPERWEGQMNGPGPDMQGPYSQFLAPSVDSNANDQMDGLRLDLQGPYSQFLAPGVGSNGSDQMNGSGLDLQGPYGQFSARGIASISRDQMNGSGLDLQGMYGRFSAPGAGSNGRDRMNGPGPDLQGRYSHLMGGSMLGFDFPSYSYGLPILMPRVGPSVPHFMMPPSNIVESSLTGLGMNSFYMAQDGNDLTEEQPQGRSGNELFNFMPPWQ